MSFRVGHFFAVLCSHRSLLSPAKRATYCERRERSGITRHSRYARDYEVVRQHYTGLRLRVIKAEGNEQRSGDANVVIR